MSRFASVRRSGSGISVAFVGRVKHPVADSRPADAIRSVQPAGGPPPGVTSTFGSPGGRTQLADRYLEKTPAGSRARLIRAPKRVWSRLRTCVDPAPTVTCVVALA